MRGETAIWAVGGIDADVTMHVIRSSWSCEEIDSFVESALEILEKLCKRDHVLDASRLARSYSADARITKDAIEREGRAGDLPATRQPWLRPRPPGACIPRLAICSHSWSNCGPNGSNP